MANDSIPAYSMNAELNLSLLYGIYDEMIIYIEDKKGVSIYESILDKLEIENIRVFPTEGKLRLINLFKEFKKDISAFENPCLFIADKDFEGFVETTMINDDNFLYLERYSIENYLVCERAGALFINGRLQKGKLECLKTLSFPTWLNNFDKDFEKLLYLFVTIQKLKIPVKNTKYKLRRFIDEETLKLDKTKLLSYFQEVYKIYKESVSTFSGQSLKSIYRETKIQVQTGYPEDRWVLIPGKQLFEAFYLHISSIVGQQPHYEDFINFVATNINTDQLFFIKERINFLRT
ncbi:DUF4435 domain-containing protein [Paenibacillus xylanexedens]|uniref:DUF4435 domain-containing protein n=1 Tax=Paenibacillus xylanexedens TaxID=528191 RepID=UPI001F1E8181|nr:DUF4435 domain-containing protein [Paenibacillus xylanexedens]MCF7756724.1 DUF4435 domain-containing protein [Paenibacillus xylanexedens]